MAQPNSYLAPCEVAAQLGVSERTVWRWIQQKKLPSVKIGGTRRVSRSALSSLLARRRAKRKRVYRRLTCPHCGEQITVAT